MNNKIIGTITGGSLKENLSVRLSVIPQSIQEGSLVVVEDKGYQFYCTVVNIMLNKIRRDLEVRLEPEEQDLYSYLSAMPALMMKNDPMMHNAHPVTVKTIPSHHAPARMASAGDISEIFGKPGENGNFVIGNTREQNHPVCIDLDKLIQRSSGIFGATGSGKSFLTRIILTGLIKMNRASILVFDMHNEYGFDDIASDTGKNVIGLRSGFGSAKVQVVGLGGSATIRGSMPDYNLVIGYCDITPEDIELLTRELNLKETLSTVLDGLVKSFGRDKWFEAFKNMNREGSAKGADGKSMPAHGSVASWAQECGVNVMAAESLHDKLRRLFNKPYIVKKAPADSIDAIIQSLKTGKHVILSFGEFESDLDYLLVSNLLTRRIRNAWEKMTNDFRSRRGKEPRQLVIVVEEAHKLLNREMACQTTFSVIAREMRKYYATLLIIDQRPSQIYDEVMSQLGTRICGWLGDEDDIYAVLSGLSGRSSLRGMLSRLQAKEEVLLLGWGVPMPILIRSRRYDDLFWQQIKPAKERSQDEMIGELYPD